MALSKTGGLNDYEALQGIGEQFFNVCHLWGRCYAEGRPVSRFFCEDSDLLFIKKYMDVEGLMAEYEPKGLYTIEDVSTEIREEGPIRLSFMNVQVGGRIITWALVGVIGDRLSEEEKDSVNKSVMSTNISRYTEEVDFLCYLTKEYFKLVALGEIASKEARETLRESVMTDAKLEKLEILNEILNIADSEEEIENIVKDILVKGSRFLKLSGAALYRINRFTGNLEPVRSWRLDGAMEEAPVKGLPLSELPFKLDATYMISADTPVPDSCRRYMNDLGARAIMRFPIKDKKDVVFIQEMWESYKDRNWELEEIKFANELREIIQRIVERRINKHSLTASYLSMKNILEELGLAVAVIDAEHKIVLYNNAGFDDIYKKDGVLDLEDIFYTGPRMDGSPLFFERLNMWISFTQKKISWVDGREVFLVTAEDISDYKTMEQQSRLSMDLDMITGLYNRKRCERDFEDVLRDCRVRNKTAALVSMDIDDFKHINSRFGMQKGDELLRNIASRLKKMKLVGDKVYRLRSDEFYVLVTADNYDNLEENLTTIQDVFYEPWTIGNVRVEITASIGVIAFPEYGETLRELEPRVEVAMYEAKRKGKNRIAIYDSDMSIESHKQMDMKEQLKIAVHDGCQEFEVFYQPIMEVNGGDTTCIGAEALLRWNSAKFGRVSPGYFIPMAEEMGLIAPLGEFVLGEACKACRYWNDFGHPEFHVNVNFSVIQLMQNDIQEIVKSKLVETRLNPENLVVEITETMEVDKSYSINNVLSEIHDAGAKVALDDFGTGYASLTNVRHLLIDTIKVDQSFVEGILVDKYADTFVKMVAELAAAINVDVCVEGVENEMQLKLLKGMNVHYIQGFYFDKPLHRTEFEEKYLV